MLTHQPKTEELIYLIQSMTSVTDVSASEGMADSKLLFSCINRYDAVPFDRLLLCVTQDDKEKWLDNCLEQANLGNTCYLCAINYTWHWFKVEALDSKKWISELLLHEEAEDFMVLAHDQKGFLGIITEDAEYLAFVSKYVGHFTKS